MASSKPFMLTSSYHDLLLVDRLAVRRMAAAAQGESTVELQMAQIAIAAMEEFDRLVLPPIRLALAAAHAAGRIMAVRNLEKAEKWRLQIDLALLLIKQFRISGKVVAS